MTGWSPKCYSSLAAKDSGLPLHINGVKNDEFSCSKERTNWRALFCGGGGLLPCETRRGSIEPVLKKLELNELEIDEFNHSEDREDNIPNLSDETLEKTVWCDPDELDYAVPDARYHTDVEIDRFQKTIYDYNGAQPIVIDRNYNIVAGQGRVEAARLLGIDEIPVLPLSMLTEDDVDHYIKTMMQFGKYVGWTREMMHIDLQHLKSIRLEMKASTYSCLHADASAE
ncbi:ParB N-terminal domain-containing protein [Ruegeria arenilitoris]|uniref:ParB N-terminal domain-containing protein n=1 Tax=Ruegeria arenilitoris TaxID=1173585 RepID=UPI00147BE9AA|nr:ParB N-terminal domain-containing protein [Ruegeria arenilitoris]